jgi:protein dithiol oxidoreductase (disulfide-forming)
MKRREFNRITSAALALGGLGMGTRALAQGKPAAGTDYIALEKRAAVDAPSGKIEVVEFFWYSCPHCNAFEPALEAWIKRLPADVAIRRVPVGFRDDFVPQQRLYYTLEAMGQLDKLHGRVFAAIHGQKLPLNKPELIADWVSKQGVDKDKFMEQFNSFTVATKVSRATQLQNAYRVEGVPALGVAGRFYTDGTLAKNMSRALDVVDYLVAEVRAGR